MSYVELHVSPVSRFSGFYKPFEKADYVILGVPFDGTSTYRPGSRFGPQAIREASRNIETYSLRTGLDAKDLKICDVGDLHVLGDVEKTLERVRLVLGEIVKAQKFPVILGGEHTITYGAIKAFEGDVGILSFDAHMDLRDEFLGSKLSHATLMRRLSEKIKPDHDVEVGVRAFGRDEFQFAKERGIKFFTGKNIRLAGRKELVKKIDKALSDFETIYLTLDMDVVDPSYAPAVGNPVPEGITPSTLLDILHDVCDQRVIALDLVEVSPHYDTGLTSFQAAHIIYETLCFIEKCRRNRG
jgi:agmatinase